MAHDFHLIGMPQLVTFTESQLCQELLIRDRLAFSYLYDHYSGALFAEILRIVKLREVAEDVLQETFIQVHRQIEQYDQAKGRLFTWLMIIARNKSIDFLRSAQARFAGRTGELPEEIGVTDKSIVENSMEHYLLQRQIKNLPENTRELIRLIYVHGYTHQEAASIQQIPIGTVKTRLRTAVQRLRGLYNIFPAASA